MWTLTPEQSARIRELLVGLPLSTNGMQPPPALGYRGFVVETEPPAGGVRISEGFVSKYPNGEMGPIWIDTDRRLEQYLLSLSPM